METLKILTFVDVGFGIKYCPKLQKLSLFLFFYMKYIFYSFYKIDLPESEVVTIKKHDERFVIGKK